jgi:hypothetical protein
MDTWKTIVIPVKIVDLRPILLTKRSIKQQRVIRIARNFKRRSRPTGKTP